MTVGGAGTAAIGFDDFPGAFAAEREAVIDIVSEVAASDEFILKGHVAGLEAAVAGAVGAEHAVAVSSGTAALTLALDAMGVGPGDEVLLPAWTFAGVASPVLARRARAVFVDVAGDSGCMDPEDLRRRITPRARVVLAVHTCCSAADMAAITGVAGERGLDVLEDSAVVIGATVQGRAAGTWGRAGAFSFFPAKPLGGIGDGGMVVTDDGDLATAVRMLRNHGQDGITRFLHHRLGYNARMDEIVAAFLGRRLAKLDAAADHRARLARRYEQRLAPLEPRLALPPAVEPGRVFYHYVVRTPARDRLQAFLAERGIESRPSYSRPLPLQPVFADLGHAPGDFPAAERWAAEGLALPLNPAMAEPDVDRVAGAVVAFHDGGSP